MSELQKIISDSLVVNEDKSLITMAAGALEDSYKALGIDLDMVNKVNEATESILLETYRASGNKAVEIFKEDNEEKPTSVTFTTGNQVELGNREISHTFTLENDIFNSYSTVDTEINYDGYTEISDELKRNFSVEL